MGIMQAADRALLRKLRSRGRIGQRIGWLLARVTLITLCLVWIIPTVGLLVNSLREKDDLVLTGWWTTLVPHDANDRARTADASAQQVIDGQYVIAGNVFTAGNPHGKITSFGDGFLDGDLADIAVGEVVETPEGWEFTLNENGDYRLASDTPFTLTEGERFFFRANYPPRLTFENYAEVVKYEGIGAAFVNTLVVAIPATVLPVAVAAYAAYAFAWMRFHGRRSLLALIVALIILPLQMIVIPILRMYRDFDLVGTYEGVWLIHSAVGLPLAIFLLRNFMITLPREIIDAAKIDGASHHQIFQRLIIPLSVPALASITLFQFLWSWNDIFIAEIFLGPHPKMEVLTMRMRDMIGCTGYNWEILTAGAFVSIIVPLALFFVLQRYFVRGLVAGAVNG